MNLDKENTKKIILIVAIGIIIYLGLQNLSNILGSFQGLLKILNPFILGACMAFVLNVVVNLIETK